MTVTEKVSYIRGLAEGLELDADKKEVKVIHAIIDLLDDLAKSTTEVEDTVTNVAGQLDEVDEDLGSLERVIYGVNDDDEEEENDEDEDEDDYYEVTCPNCHETICLSQDIVEDGQMKCPNCGELLEFEVADDEDCDSNDDDCGCGCGCCDEDNGEKE